MKKREFLNQLEEKVKAVEKYQLSNVGDIDGAKEQIIPIIQKEFLESVPKKIKRGQKIKISCKGFELERISVDVFYIIINDKKIKIGNWCDGLNVLKHELIEDLSELVDRDVKCSIDDNCMKFYFYW